VLLRKLDIALAVDANLGDSAVDGFSLPMLPSELSESASRNDSRGRREVSVRSESSFKLPKLCSTDLWQ
jgi:hypothetical protein